MIKPYHSVVITSIAPPPITSFIQLERFYFLNWSHSFLTLDPTKQGSCLFSYLSLLLCSIISFLFNIILVSKLVFIHLNIDPWLLLFILQIVDVYINRGQTVVRRQSTLITIIVFTFLIVFIVRFHPFQWISIS